MSSRLSPHLGWDLHSHDNSTDTAIVWQGPGQSIRNGSGDSPPTWNASKTFLLHGCVGCSTPSAHPSSHAASLGPRLRPLLCRPLLLGLAGNIFGQGLPAGEPARAPSGLSDSLDLCPLKFLICPTRSQITMEIIKIKDGFLHKVSVLASSRFGVRVRSAGELAVSQAHPSGCRAHVDLDPARLPTSSQRRCAS